MKDERMLILLGRRARQLREKLGLKQEEMTRFGFDVKYYQRIEYGQKNITVRTLNRLAVALEVSVADLFNFDELPTFVRALPGRPRKTKL
jgi:transcriptional regulator with XRE-family HTH domain